MKKSLLMKIFDRLQDLGQKSLTNGLGWMRKEKIRQGNTFDILHNDCWTDRSIRREFQRGKNIRMLKITRNLILASEQKG